tara:strand:+ start:497 stop:892 length:396 start_codon:yes stop_codon:yes gene_type:complete
LGVVLLNKHELIDRVEGYFKYVDNGNISKLLTYLTPNCKISVVTSNITHEGRDTGIKKMFERRLLSTEQAWHGNFKHLADTKLGWVTSRFDVHRTNSEGKYREMDNINFFEFETEKICRISIWMSGENSLI